MEERLPHKLSLNDRQQLTVSGVTEVVSFEDTSVILHTHMGTLVVQGRDLQLKMLSLDGGQTEVTGTVTALVYEEPRAVTGGWLRRLLG